MDKVKQKTNVYSCQKCGCNRFYAAGGHTGADSANLPSYYRCEKCNCEVEVLPGTPTKNILGSWSIFATIEIVTNQAQNFRQ